MSFSSYSVVFHNLNYREELRTIFVPQFEKILALIGEQIEHVDRSFGPGSLKVRGRKLDLLTPACFSCRWIGSNEYLRRYLIQLLPRNIAIRQPMNR